MSFADRLLRRGQPDELIGGLLQDTTYRIWAGPIAMAVGMGLVDLAVLQPDRVHRRRARHLPSIGDLAFAAGFVIAGALYVALLRIPGLGPARGVASTAPASANVARWSALSVC